MLSLNNITAEKGGKVLFRGIGASIFPGTCLIIQGANGTGKTTLLRIIAQLTDYTYGSINYNNVDVRDAIEEYYLITSYIGHEKPLQANLTVYETLDFWSKIYNIPEKLQSALQCFDLCRYQDTEVANLSQGWKAKLSLSQLLLMNSMLWLLDEPFVNLDERGKSILTSMIEAKCASHGIVIITSTDNAKRLDNSIILNLEDFA